MIKTVVPVAKPASQKVAPAENKNGKMIGGPFTPLIEYLDSIHTMDTECVDSVYIPKQQEQQTLNHDRDGQSFPLVFAFYCLLFDALVHIL